MNQTSSPLLGFVKAVNSFSDWTGRVVSWAVLAIVVLTFVIVVMRYVFNTGSVFMQELVVYFHAYVIMLGAAYALLKGAHVRVDIFYRPKSAVHKAWVDLLGTFFLLLPTCLFIIYIGWEYVAASWRIMEGSQEAGGVDFRYLFKSSIIIMPVMMILQGLAEAAKSLLVIGGHENLIKAVDQHEEEHGL